MADSPAPSRFAWPPKPLAVEVIDRSPTEPRELEPRPSILRQLRSAFSDIEREWLDPVALPLAQRAAEAGWGVDEAGAYCDHCGRDIGAYETNELRCSRCINERLPWDRCVRLGPYEADLAEWICEVKFTRFRSLGFELGRELGRRVRSAGFVGGEASNAIVVPVPTSLRRRLSRGIDHSAVIARGVSWELNIPLRFPLGRRHRPSQRAVAVSDRVRNVSGSMFLKRRSGIAGRTIVLVDDVMTTGATMRVASRALRSGPKGEQPRAIWAAVLSVTPDGAGQAG